MIPKSPTSPHRLAATALRWSCDLDCLRFETTAEVGPATDSAQPTARDALDFGLRIRAPGQNVYVRGLRGTGRRTMVRRMLQELALVAERPLDRCYVHNFRRPDRPRLLSLPAGQGRLFQKRMRELAEFVSDDLPKALESAPLVSERAAVELKVKAKIEEITAPLERDLDEAGMKLVSIQQGPIAQTMILPVVEDQPIPASQLRTLVRQGKVSKERLERFEELEPEFQKRLQAVSVEVVAVQRAGLDQLRQVTEQAIRRLLESLVAPLAKEFGTDGVSDFLGEVVVDAIERQLSGSEDGDAAERYSVNVVLDQEPGCMAPIVEEASPSLDNLLGTVEIGWGRDGPEAPSHAGIRAGALLRADGGFLILDVYDLLSEPGSWRALTRTLRTGKLEIVPPELTFWRPQSLIHPEPIDISVRVILIGDPLWYYQLDGLDPDFGELFKTLADFDPEIDRDETGVHQYAAVIAELARAETLLPFHRTGVGALVEHGARIAARRGKLTARFGRIADLAREASFLARGEGGAAVQGEHVREAVRRTKHRASLPSRKFQQLINSGTIRVETRGATVGQINGLAVIQAGPLTYGFPARITATIGAGRAGLISIEGSSSLSGSIHTKGFHILGGLLRQLLRADHPLAFSASIAFEQSYGGIDGDSASGAEICCLLSALTGVPIRQNLAMTGAIDQHGHIQPIGGANEKIEGFFDVCQSFGLTGDQGVIIPRGNAGDLMLRQDVVEACREERFHIFAVSTVHEALEILTGEPAGEYKSDGYAEGTLLRQAVDQAREFWRKTLQSPTSLTATVDDGGDGEESEPPPGTVST